MQGVWAMRAGAVGHQHQISVLCLFCFKASLLLHDGVFLEQPDVDFSIYQALFQFGPRCAFWGLCPLGPRVCRWLLIRAIRKCHGFHHLPD